MTKTAPSEVWLCGDVHGKIHHLIRLLEQVNNKPKAILLLGDIDPPEPIGAWLAPLKRTGAEVWFIHGNHETDTAEQTRNTFYCDGATMNLHGRVVEVAGLRVAGLGGVFRADVWFPKLNPDPLHRNYADFHAKWLSQSPNFQRQALPEFAGLDGLPLFSDRVKRALTSIFPDTYDALGDLQADLLLTHEAPSCHPHGFAELDVLAQAMGTRWLAHGHHHEDHAYPGYAETLGFHAIGVGYRGVTSLAGEVLLGSG
jgi:predicted phosphodiesterase